MEMSDLNFQQDFELLLLLLLLLLRCWESSTF
jgi:hypothetical protein